MIGDHYCQWGMQKGQELCMITILILIITKMF